jgi:cytochrome P450
MTTQASPAYATAPNPSAASLLRRGYNPLARRVEERGGFPVAPGRFPVLGHIPALAVDALGFMRDMERQVGPLYYVNFGFDDWQLTYTDKEAISIFRNKVTHSEPLRATEAMSQFLGQSLIVHDGPIHHHMRSTMNGPFQPRGLSEARVGETVADLVERCARRWAGRRDVRVLADTRELALTVLFRVVGVDEGEIATWRVQYEDLTLLLLPIRLNVPGSPHDRGLKARAWINGKLREIVARVRAKGDTTGLLPSLLAARDEDGAPLSEQELIDNLRLVFFGGHETSASIMAWMVAHLAERPDVWRRLRDEARAASGLPRSPKELRQFPYAEAVFRETLRLHPPAFRDTRGATTDFDLAGRTIKRGTVLNIPILTLSRDPELYPDPDAFRPERWMDRKGPPTPMETVQFATGPHFCLGYHLAWMEIVAFAVALGRELPAAGPRLHGAFPASRYLPMLHPAPSTRVRFD